MNFTVYGFRLKGALEARYIGQTGEGPQTRLDRLAWEARRYSPGATGGLRGWLLTNHGNLEAFEIVTVETRAEARAAERQAVAVCLALGHRLFNEQLVPADVRSARNAEPQDRAA